MKKQLASTLFFLCFSMAAWAVQVIPGHQPVSQIAFSPDGPPPPCLPDQCNAR